MVNDARQFVGCGSDRFGPAEPPFHLAVKVPEIILGVIQAVCSKPQCDSGSVLDLT